MRKAEKEIHSSSIKLPQLKNNPLDIFPTKGDVIRRAYVMNTSKTLSHLDESSNGVSNKSKNSHWLNPDKLSSNVNLIIFQFTRI